ncbi:hypothetical protein Shyhy01_32470 [Streptomyces hygroscopicus subsp. hygroscopicus]|nr:hypothetical protein Shyhy01_32470 [Streptomyces hygroscopicus subsp. hygroscopicus]
MRMGDLPQALLEPVELFVAHERRQRGPALLAAAGMPVHVDTSSPLLGRVPMGASPPTCRARAERAEAAAPRSVRPVLRAGRR